MSVRSARSMHGVTLIEVLTSLLILTLLALMSYRGLGAVLDAREHVSLETEKWRRVAAFFSRFERDIQLAAPRPVRNGSGTAPAWLGQASRAGVATEPRLAFSRFASVEGTNAPRRVGYGLNENQEIELWLWTALDLPNALQADTKPTRYTVLSHVTKFEVLYLNADLAWVDVWPASQLNAADSALPRAVQLRIVLASGEEVVRVFALSLP